MPSAESLTEPSECQRRLIDRPVNFCSSFRMRCVHCGVINCLSAEDYVQLQEDFEDVVSATVYVDGDKADVVNVKAHLGRETVYRSAVLPTGKPVINHAKFVIDREMLLLTSANFSFSTENRNVEFGLLVQDSAFRIPPSQVG